MDKMLLDLPEQLESERLRLRPYRAGEGVIYYRLCLNNREHLLPFEAGNPALTVETVNDAEILVRRYAADWVARNIFFMGAWEKATNALVAQIVVMPVNWELPEMGVGYFADRDHQGQGFVTEGVQTALGFAFNWLGAQRVRLECNETNLRSIRVAERCGFVREGFIRQTHKDICRADGTPSGDYLYGMLREEFAARYGLSSPDHLGRGRA